MKTADQIQQCAPITTVDEADEIAQWMADILLETFRGSNATLSIYCIRRLSELLGTRFKGLNLMQSGTPPLTLKVIDAAAALIREIEAAPNFAVKAAQDDAQFAREIEKRNDQRARERDI